MKELTKTMGLNDCTIDFLDNPAKMLINGEWVSAQSGETFKTINPADGSFLNEIPLAGNADVNTAVNAAKKSFETVWNNTTTPADRASLLWKLADLMERDKQILMELETLDNGKPLEKARYDVDSAINHFRYYAGWATKIEGNTLPVGNDSIAYTKREPLGVTGLIVPWNFPLMIAAWKLAPALACGNCCVLKPAEQTSLSALYLGKLIEEAGFPNGVVNIVTGPGLPTGQAISSHMNIDKVSFTGSTKVGRQIMEAAAHSNLKKVSLELGGKSPNIIFEDANLDHVFESIVWSSFYNTGQECTLGSRIYVQRSIYQKVVDILKTKADSLKINKGMLNPDLGPMISESQLQTVLKYIDIGINEGAELITGGKRIQGELGNGYFIEPTIFAHQNDQLQIVQEEIFGPVVVISSFDTFDEVVARANDSIYGLAAAVWTNDISKAHRFANKVQSGTVWINGYDMFDPSVPFGGFKQSGIGKEMGKSAIELYTKEKTVWIGLKD
ncbi:aldehyde dehydrogenase family protein [Lutimonas saemankumensis]|uniref:aldehyde dehydrogenase family protein n=1 Tax=Lutimonas saemankumensis TaxID=483016 RepID=UPI001CD77800|nr:aldehyde dehydrogenase family protein [Lutimonas saemankumensis]MCA0933646.1 aldehyde dehydrogenase family protein [Lutimonas saemankumensis]